MQSFANGLHPKYIAKISKPYQRQRCAKTRKCFNKPNSHHQTTS